MVSDPIVLTAAFWPRRKTTPTPTIRHGDADDPLAGVASLRTDGEQVDVIVGRGAWMAAMLTRRIWVGSGPRRLPIVDRADLVLLKLYAAGPQDLLDIRLLLEADSKGLVVQSKRACRKPLARSRRSGAGLAVETRLGASARWQEAAHLMGSP